MARQFWVEPNNRKDALKKARARISRLNKDPKGYKGEEVKLKSVKKDEGKGYIATIVRRRSR